MQNGRARQLSTCMRYYCISFLSAIENSVVRGCLKGKGVQLVKKKKTIYPEWNTSFDFHLYEGRVIHMEIIQRPDVKVAECSILAQSLADLAKDGEPTSVWVIYKTLLAYPGLSGR